MLSPRLLAFCVVGAPLLLLNSGAPRVVQAETLYVNQATGRDDAAGRSRTTALKTIQAACDRVQPGDTIVVATGVYFEQVALKRAGTAKRPIILRADSVARHRVVLSGADPTLRKGASRWQCDDAALQLYSAPLDHKPARVLYDDVDLLPYPDLASLKRFRMPGGYPGTFHGFAFDPAGKRLYVRLHASGKYGSTDPNRHRMCVSPPTGGGGAGNVITRPDQYNIALLPEKDAPAHVVLEGFTFETPGVAGVYARGGNVTVRNCWFLGCRTGVAGRAESEDTTQTTNNVTIERCDYGAYPAYDDMREVIQRYWQDPERPRGGIMDLYWWQRKGDQADGNGIGYENTYEIGIASMIGQGWAVRHNRIHDNIDGLSCWALRWSRGLQVYQNRFERLIDNAVETEDHAVDMRVHDNYITDTFEPFSWQPLGGQPWPGSVYIYRNVVWASPAHTDVWTLIGGFPGSVKIGASDKNWTRAHMKDVPSDRVRASGTGVTVFNNTFYYPGSRFLTRVQPDTRLFENFRFLNNLCIGGQVDRDAAFDGKGLAFDGNIGVFLKQQAAGPAHVWAGTSGQIVATLSLLGLSDPAHQQFELTAASRARGAAVPVPGLVEAGITGSFRDAGALPFGQRWTPPEAGPRVQAASPKRTARGGLL